MPNATARPEHWRVAFVTEMDLRHTLFWGCVAVTALAELFLLRSAFFPPAPPASETSETLPRSPRAVEILWGVLPAIMLAGVFGAAYHSMVLR